MTKHGNPPGIPLPGAGVLVQRFLRYALLLVMRCRQSCYAAFCVQRRQNDKTWKSPWNPAPRDWSQHARSARGVQILEPKQGPVSYDDAIHWIGSTRAVLRASPQTTTAETLQRYRMEFSLGTRN